MHLPIIALTTSAMEGDRKRCVDPGMDGYLTKPIRIRELFAEIERVLCQAVRSNARDVGTRNVEGNQSTASTAALVHSIKRLTLAASSVGLNGLIT